MALIKKNVVGEFAIYRFVHTDGTVVKKYDTDTDYNRRFIDDPKNQINPLPSEYGLSDADYTWKHASRATKFDTVTGELEEGQYAVLDADRIIYNTDGRYDIMAKALMRSLLSIDPQDVR